MGPTFSHSPAPPASAARHPGDTPMVATVIEPEQALPQAEMHIEPTGRRPMPLSHVPLHQVPLPPSERDFDVYRLVAVEGESTRAAAGQFGISQTRVIQIRKHVAEWIADELPWLATGTPAQRLAVGANLA